MNVPFSLTDRYQATAHLARGGMADVFQGEDNLLGRKVAIKVLHSQLSNDEAFVKRFRKEAQAAANLTHPNIVGIFDWGQFDSTYFIVMELVEGRSLREVLRSGGALLPRRAVEIAAEAAAALSVAHRSGLVHRDVKPGNIMLSPDGTVKVTDFGIARAWDDSSELTRTGAVMGTATYFSPEQAQGEPVDERSDVYSLGVVLYEMLTGRPPFRGDSPVSVAYQHVSTLPHPPSTINPDVPPELDEIVMRALQKDPSARFRTAEDFRAALWRVLHGEPAAAPPPVADDQPTQMMAAAAIPPATVPPDEAYRQLEEPPSSNLAFIIGTFVLLTTLGILVFLVLQLLNGGNDEPVAAATIPVPAVEGLTEAEALQRLQAAGFIVIPDREPDENVAEGLVIRTDPPSGTELADGSSVRVLISSGIEQFGVPFLVGLERSDAEGVIRDQGFVVGNVELRSDPDRAAGLVIDQSPAFNEQVQAGTAIDLVVSSGPDTVTMRPLEGLVEREATDVLQALGLDWNITTEFSPDVERGRVIRTEPVGPAELFPGDTVDIVISDGPEPVEVPDLFGLTETEARTVLEELGLVMQVSVARLEVSDPELVDRVVAQSVQPGETLLPEDIVTITLGAPPPTTTTTVPPDSTTTTTVGGG